MRILTDYQFSLWYTFDMMTEYQKQWQRDNKEKCRAYSKKWREKNKAQVALYHKLHDQNPERKAAKNEAVKRWRERNPEVNRERSRQWAKDNPEYVRFMNRERMKKIRNSGTFTFEEWMAMKESYKLTCPSCKKIEPEIVLQTDHIKPISKGGANIAANIQPLCGPCNRTKYTKEIRYEMP